MSPPPLQMSPTTAAAAAAERRAAAAAAAAVERRNRTSQPPPPPQQQPPPPPPPPPPFDFPWIISIRQKLDQARQYEASSPWTTLCIYHVPKPLRGLDKTAYTPQIVSIGPYHRGRSNLRDMDLHKWRALHRALLRAGHDVQTYLDVARSLEDRARACYETPLSISSDAFVECLVLDSIFTLELFRGVSSEGFSQLGYDPNDPVFADRGIMNLLQRDMIMLENQLPLFVLDCFFALQLGNDPSRSNLVAPLALNFFDPIRPIRPTEEPLRPTNDPLPSNAGSSRGLHCLDVFHRSFLCPRPPSCGGDLEDSVNGCNGSRLEVREFHLNLDVSEDGARLEFGTDDSNLSDDVDGSDHADQLDKRRQQLIPSVAKLRHAGIAFRSRKSDQFLEIEFEDGVMYIPCLQIDNSTKYIFHNLIAFEHCNLKKGGRRITSYVAFMSNLIDSAVDVKYLRDKKIIEHRLGNDGEVADMFKRLSQEVVFDINKLSERVNSYCGDKWTVCRAVIMKIIKQSSFRSTIISIVVSVVVNIFYVLSGFH